MSKLFLFLCTLLAVYMSISGFATIKKPSESIFHFIFLPTTLYLVYISIKQLTHPRQTPDVSLSKNKTQLIPLAFFFILLLVIGIRSVTLSSPKPLPKTISPLIIHPARLPSPPISSATSSALFLIVFHPNPNGLVNLRSEPNTKSALLQKIPAGTVLTYTELVNDWYKIKLANNSTGWISSQYASPSAAKP